MQLFILKESKMRNILSLFVIAGVMIAGVAYGQSVVGQNVEVRQNRGLETPVTVNLDGVSLSQALRTIARQADIKITLAEPVIAVNKRVKLSLVDVPVSAAFRSAIAGTGVDMTLTQTGQVMFTRQVGSTGKASGIIIGKVTDAKTGRSISGANVSIGNDVRGTITDENGSYRLTGVAVGTHVVIVRLVGYAKQTKQVIVGEGVAVTADFKLDPSASVLNEVVVTGTVVSTELKAVPNAITVITAKQIEERGITRIDQLFRGDVPGLFSLNLGSSVLLDEVTMFSRGAIALTSNAIGGDPSNPTAALTKPIKTYIDGVEMADSKYLSQIDPSTIERIEILTGPQASTIYGSGAINGVMQIFTKRGSTSKPRLSLNLSSGVAQNNFNSHLAPSHVVDASLSGIEGKISYNAGGSWNYTGAWTPSRLTQRGSFNGGVRMEWAQITADGSARRGITNNKQNGDQAGARTNLSIIGVFNPSASAGIPTRMAQTLLGKTYAVSLGYRPFSWWLHNVGFGSDASTRETFSTGKLFQRLSDTTLSLRSSIVSSLSQRYTTTLQLPIASLVSANLTLGGDHKHTESSQLSGFSSLALVGSLNANSGEVRDQPDKSRGAFLQGQLVFKDVLFFTYGLRADWHPNFGDKAKVKPGRYGIAFTHDIGPVSAKLRGSYGRSIVPPAYGLEDGAPMQDESITTLFGPFDYQLANPYLGPEHQQGGEGGIELYFGSRASLEITRYNQTVDNLITSIGAADSVRSLVPNLTNSQCGGAVGRDAEGHCYWLQSQYLNVGSIRNQGWELRGTANVGPFTARGTYSWTQSRIIGITPKFRALMAGRPEFEPGRPFDYVPEHTWAWGLTYTHAQGSLGLSVNGIGMRYISIDDLQLIATSTNRFSSGRPRMTLNTLNYRPKDNGYATADLSGMHRFASRVDGTIQISNLTNYYRNDYNAGEVAIGRQTRIGARIRW